MTSVHIRALTAEDGAKAAAVFFDAVHRGAAGLYSVEQRAAWAGTTPDVEGWRGRLVGVAGFAAETGGRLVGFMTIDSAGYIDLAFVRADAARQGVGRKLYAAVEAWARESGAKRLTTEASKVARPFFEQLGWQVEKEQAVVKRGVTLVNYRMCKMLDATGAPDAGA